VAGSDYQATYGYDAVGNRDTQVVDGVPTAFTYNLGNKVTEIVSGEPASLRLLFTYDADLNLVTRRETVGNVESVYVSGLFERRSSPEPGKNYEHVFTIVGPEVAVAEVTRTFPEEEVSAFTTATRYLHRDHLGSISSTTDEDGEVVHRLSFDAWGQRRPAVISDDNQSLPASAVHEGFTGHDNALEVLGLIDMKGRLMPWRRTKTRRSSTSDSGCRSKTCPLTAWQSSDARRVRPTSRTCRAWRTASAAWPPASGWASGSALTPHAGWPATCSMAS